MTQKNSDLSNSRFNRYCKMGLGATVVAGAVTTMDASVVFTNYNGQVLSDTNVTDTAATVYSFDFNNDGINDIRLYTRNAGTQAGVSNYALVGAGVTGNSLHPINVVGFNAGNYTYPSRLNAGAAINSARNFVTLALTASSTYLAVGTFAFGNGFTNSQWKNAGANQGFLGVSFTLPDGLHYGFIGLTVQAQGNGNLSRSFSIGTIAYETTPNTPITTFGQVGVAVPEPSSLGLVALGGLGLVAYRRHRRAAVKA